MHFKISHFLIFRFDFGMGGSNCRVDTIGTVLVFESKMQLFFDYHGTVTFEGFRASPA